MFRRLTSHETMVVVNWAILAMLTISVSLNLALALARDDRVMIVLEIVILTLLGATIAHASFRAGRRRERHARAEQTPPRIRQVGPDRIRIELGPNDGDCGWDINVRLGPPVEPDEPPVTVHPESWIREHRN